MTIMLKNLIIIKDVTSITLGRKWCYYWKAPLAKSSKILISSVISIH